LLDLNNFYISGRGVNALCKSAIYGHYVFALWFLSFYLVSSPNLSGHTLDVYHTSTHAVALAQIKNAGLKCAASGLMEIQDAKMMQKIAIRAPSDNYVRLYLRN